MSKAPQGDVNDFSFAEDVAWVWRHIHERVGEKKDGYTLARKHLHDWATKKLKDGETLVNYEAFMKMAAAAEKTLKDSKKTEPDFVVRQERKAIAELQDLLAQTIEESEALLI